MIKLAQPIFSENVLPKIEKILASGHLTKGKYTTEFRESISAFYGGAHCEVTSSGTQALIVAYLALGLEPGSTILAPAFTFPATANAAEILGLNCRFYDVDPETYSGTDRNFKEVYKKGKASAIVVVDEFGYPADLTFQLAEMKFFDLPIVQDAACAFGAKYANGKLVGKYSDITCFSFHPRKNITSGEGGALITESPIYADKISQLMNHGFDSSGPVSIGLNGRLPEISALLGVDQLNTFEQNLQKRRELAEVYINEFVENKNFRLPKYHPGHSWQSFMIVLNKDIHRDELISKLREKGIETNFGAHALNCLPYYQKKYELEENSFPIASELYQRGLVLPIHAGLSKNDVKYVCDTLGELL